MFGKIISIIVPLGALRENYQKHRQRSFQNKMDFSIYFTLLSHQEIKYKIKAFLCTEPIN